MMLRLETKEIFAMSAIVLAILPPLTPAIIGIYQRIIVTILLLLGILDANQATAYGLLVFGAQLIVWVILGIFVLKKSDIKISKLSQGVFDQNQQ